MSSLGISESSLKKIKQPGIEHWRELAAKDKDTGKKTYRERSAKFEEIDKAVLLWFRDKRALFVPISGEMVRVTALKFAQKAHIPTDGPKGFKASKGWLQNWQVRRDTVV